MPQIDNVANEPWTPSIVLNGEKSTSILYHTANKFMDRDFKVEISVNDGSVSPYFDNTNISTYFNSGSAGSNSISITPKATSAAGFIGAHDTSSALTGTAVYYTIKSGTSKAGSADVNIDATDGSANGVNISAIVGTKATSEPTSGYYLAFKGEGNSKVNAAGWFAANTSLTKTTSGTKYFPITAAAITASSSNATATTTVAPGTVTIAKDTSSVSGKTRLDYTPSTATSGIGTYYIAVKANAAANTTGTTSSISGTATASVSTAGYAPTTLSGSGNISGTATAKTSSKDSSVYYIPVPSAVATITGTNTVTPSASLSQSNVTFSDTNNGISVTATGGGTASVTAKTNTTTAGYIPAGDNFSTTLSASSNTTTTTKYITGITVPKDKGFTVTTTADTELDTTSDLDITNAAYRRVDITNAANGSIIVSNAGNIAATQSAKTGNIIINAYDTSSSSSLAGEKTIVQSGVWKTTAASGANTYYGRVTVGAVSGSIGGSASGGSATAAIANTNSIATISDISGKTAGTDYWQIKATATGSAGSYTPKYTVNTAGWIGSTVTGTAQSVSVSSDTTGKSLYIPKATFSVSGNKVYCSAAGYIPAGSASSPIGTVSTGTISAVASDPGTGYTENTSVVIASGGWLKLTAGYYGATKISLATLVPDAANISNVSGYSDAMLAGTTAYDVDGALVTGNIETYDGSYTVIA